ncbi:MAG TPA: contractile injection system tape measure protein [Chitinophagaceae bacterium]|jgi:hypothetical protein
MIKKNIIQKNVVDIRLFKSSPSVSLQQEASAWCNEKLLPAIEKRLERYASKEEVIRLDTVSLELANPGKELTEELAEKVALEIERVIESKINSIIKDTEVKTQPKEKSFIETLIFFLLNGYLPWWSDVKTVADFYEQWNENRTGFSAEDTQALKEILRQPVAARRLASIHPQQILLQMLSTVFDAGYDSLEKHLMIAEKLKAIIHDKNLQENFIVNVKEILSTTIQRGKFLASDEVIFQMLSLIISRFQIDKDTVLTFFQDHSILSKSELAGIKKSLSKIAGKSPLSDESETFDKSAKKKEKQAKQKKEGIYISNAGLVIVAPFLPGFFQNIGVALNNGLNNKDLATAIVQWLVTGNEEYAEFELVLPKILCGMEPEDNITMIDAIPGTFKQEGVELLQSVIEHWSILKNTSIEGLRLNFLQREGKLSFIKNEWLLQVEQKAYDMLLQHLPWNISMIKLPWMPKLLKTEWVS